MFAYYYVVIKYGSLWVEYLIYLFCMCPTEVYCTIHHLSTYRLEISIVILFLLFGIFSVNSVSQQFGHFLLRLGQITSQVRICKLFYPRLQIICMATYGTYQSLLARQKHLCWAHDVLFRVQNGIQVDTMVIHALDLSAVTFNHFNDLR